MIAAISPVIALDIIASYGADPARWPDDVRVALLALVAQDESVAAALADAWALDAALTSWANASAEWPTPDIAAILALPQEGTAASRRANAWRPALLAASLTLLVAVGGWFGLSGRMNSANSTRIAAAPPSAGASAGEADAAFAYVFTPTAAEEDLI